MAVTYTTIAIVRERLIIYASAPADGIITNYILMAEGIVNAIMKKSFLATFNADKHTIIRSATTDLAAYWCISYDASLHPDLKTAALTADMLLASFNLTAEQLADSTVVKYLASL